ncbi:MAG TPA: sigma-70 family RNA polymerase sigma factor, partial [Turneriella sp.]|nr:sigma-70 family RNA polymerase sigma factor [Turneriella sp.]
DLLRILGQAVALLPAKERELFELRWHENLTQAEIAVVLKKSERQVRRDLEKLVSRLRASFREQGWPVDGAGLV